MVIFEGAHLLELLLHAPAPFHGEFEELGNLFLGRLPVRVDEGWLYVAAVVDLFSRRVVGWS